MRQKFHFILFSLLWIPVVVHAQDNTDDLILKTFHTISSHEIISYAEGLSSEKYKGRLSGSPEYLETAKWCAGMMEQWGIKPGNGDSWFQYFPNPYSDVKNKGKVVFKSKTGKKTELVFPDQFMPGSNSDNGRVSGQMVYAGYGITAPELDYDDYGKVDVQGKIVILEPGVPYTRNDSVLGLWTPYAYHRYKFENAILHGAKGLLYVGTIANPNTSFNKGFIYAHISEKVVEQIFTDSGQSYSGVKTALKEMRTPSFALDKKLTAEITASTAYFPDGQSCNVVGMIEGSDPELMDEVIIVGGHLDGQGHPGGLFPGALDNASGVADILGAAKALAKSGIKLSRPVLFILFGGEECGLYGSTHYINHPLFPVEKTTCMINLDMVGNGTGFFLSNGKSYPEIFNHFQKANEKYLHRSLSGSEQRKYFGRPRTDAAIFENSGIPAFSLYTSESVHPVYYHHPLDRTDVLTPEIMEDAARLLYVSILYLANHE